MACTASSPCLEPWRSSASSFDAAGICCANEEFGEIWAGSPRHWLPPRVISEALAASGRFGDAAAEAASPRRGGDDEALRANLRAAHAGLGQGDEAKVLELLSELLTSDVPAQLLGSLSSLSFESRKEAMWLFASMLELAPRLGLGGQLAAYVSSHQELCELLIEGCGRPELALHHELALRACARHPELEAMLLQADAPLRLLSLARTSGDNFYTCAEALACLRELLLPGRSAAASYVEAHFSEFFEGFHGLLLAADYVTQRQSLKLLGELLLDPSCARVMQAYAREDSYLRIHMDLLRATSASIRVGAFHVFKIFVANPHKPMRVRRILCKNSRRLVRLLSAFASMREDDYDFVQDHVSVVRLLESMVLPETSEESPCASS